MIAFLFLVVWFVFIAYFCSLPLARRPLRILQRWRVDFAFEFFALVVTIGNQVAVYTAYLLHGLRRLVNSFGDLFFGLRRLGDFLVDLLGACWLRFARPQRRFEVLEEVVVVNEWWVVTIRPQIWDQPGRAQAFTINADARTGVSELHDPLSTRPWRNWLVPAMRIHDGMDQDSLNTANDVRRWWRGQIADERRFTDTPVIDGDTVVLVPSAGSRYCLRVWARMAGGLRQRVQRLTVLERFQQQCPEDYDILVAKRYKRERYLQSGCLSFIPYLERSVERAHRERMMLKFSSLLVSSVRMMMKWFLTSPSGRAGMTFCGVGFLRVMLFGTAEKLPDLFVWSVLPRLLWGIPECNWALSPSVVRLKCVACVWLWDRLSAHLKAGVIFECVWLTCRSWWIVACF
jgi:hypothetical protein